MKDEMGFLKKKRKKSTF